MWYFWIFRYFWIQNWYFWILSLVLLDPEPELGMLFARNSVLAHQSMRSPDQKNTEPGLFCEVQRGGEVAKLGPVRSWMGRSGSTGKDGGPCTICPEDEVN